MNPNERVATIMSANPVTVHTHQSVGEVHRVMANGQFHHVPVVAGKKLLGMISTTDMTRAAFELAADDGKKTTRLDHSRTAEDLMQGGLVTVTPSDTIRHATEVLAKDWFHALPVVEGDDELVGIITTTDILRYMLEQY